MSIPSILKDHKGTLANAGGVGALVAYLFVQVSDLKQEVAYLKAAHEFYHGKAAKELIQPEAKP